MKESILGTAGVIVASALVAAGVAWAGGQGSFEAFGIPVPLICAALAFAVNWLAFVPAYRARTERYYDLVGSLTYLSLIACGVLLAEPDPRGWLLAGQVSAGSSTSTSTAARESAPSAWRASRTTPPAPRS